MRFLWIAARGPSLNAFEKSDLEVKNKYLLLFSFGERPTLLDCLFKYNGQLHRSKIRIFISQGNPCMGGIPSF